MGPTFWSKYFYETRLSDEFLGPLIDFLAYLDKKLCHKSQKVVKIPIPSNANLVWKTPRFYMAITRP